MAGSGEQTNQQTNQNQQDQNQQGNQSGISNEDKAKALFNQTGEGGKTTETPKAEEPKPGDLLSTKKADGTDKTAEELAADKTKHEAAEAERKANEPITLEKLKAPEGIDLKSPLAKKFVDLINNKDLKPGDRPQALLDLVKDLKQDYDNRAAQMWLDTNKTWQTELITEFGEDRLEGMLGKISGLMTSYGREMTDKFKAANPTGKPPDFEKELRQMMTLTGAGNNPAIIKFANWMAEQLGEGAPLTGGTPGDKTASAADKLYDRK